MGRPNKREQDGVDTASYNVLPTPESDEAPNLTRFMLDIGEFYSYTSSRERKFKAIAFNKIAKYLSDAFIEILKKELKIG